LAVISSRWEIGSDKILIINRIRFRFFLDLKWLKIINEDMPGTQLKEGGFVNGKKMATVENCSLADRMDRVYEKNLNNF
jgi:hypothetical protein